MYLLHSQCDESRATCSIVLTHTSSSHHQPCHHSKVIFVLNDATIKNLSSESSSSSASYVNASLLESLRSMKVKEIKSELDSMRVSTSDVFEKEELVHYLSFVRDYTGTLAMREALTR